MFYAYNEDYLPEGLTPNLYSYPAILAFKSKEDRDSFVSFQDKFSLAFHVTKENAWSERRKIGTRAAKKLLRAHTHTYLSSWPAVETAACAYSFYDELFYALNYHKNKTSYIGLGKKVVDSCRTDFQDFFYMYFEDDSEGRDTEDITFGLKSIFCQGCPYKSEELLDASL